MNYVQFLYATTPLCAYFKPVTQMDIDRRDTCALWRHTGTTIAITGPESGKGLNFHRHSNVDRIVTYPASGIMTVGAGQRDNRDRRTVNVANTSHRGDWW